MLGLLQRRKEVATPRGASADISGSVNESQLAIGDHIVQNNIAAGAIVNQIAGEQAPQPPRARDKPVSVKPREAPRLVGRDKELTAANSALASREPVQFSGRSGAGKTAMLRHLAHRTEGAFPDGVIYYRSRRESLDDLLMRIFEFLYTCEERLKPTSAELCLYLEDTQALLLLDDVDLEREDLETLLLTLPRSVFVFGSPERSLWVDGTAISLRGLGDDAALMLVEQYLGRPLASDEHGDFAALCRALDGQPLQIIKAVTQVREEGVPVAELVAPGSPFPSAPAQLSAQMAETLTPEARQALILMAALGGAPLHVDHVAALTGSHDAAALLADLEARGLAKSHSPRYSVTDGSAGQPLSDDEARWRRRLLSYFADHAEAHAGAPERLRDDLEPMIASLRGGAAAGEWRAVLRLARVADPIATSSKLWGAWATILGIALDAARRLGDEAQEAWALHQLGTRALCLGDSDEASRRLGEALRIRERIGDHAADITRHNLSQLPGAPPAPPGRPPVDPVGPAGTPGWMAPLCVGIVAMVGVAGISTGNRGDPLPPDRPAIPAGSADTTPERAPGAERDEREPGDVPQRIAQGRLPRPLEPPGRERRQPKVQDSQVPDDDAEPGDELPSDDWIDDGTDPYQPTTTTATTPASQPPPPPPPPPVDPPVTPLDACTADAGGALSSLIQKELEVLEPLLEVDAPAALERQVEVLRELLAYLGYECSPSQITLLARSAAG